MVLDMRLFYAVGEALATRRWGGSRSIRNLLAALGFLAECVVEKDQSGHGFNHRDGAGEDARVMTAATFEGGVLEVEADCFLFHHHSGNWFEGGAEVNRFTIGNPALHTAGAVCGGADFAIDGTERIVVLGAGELDGGEAGTDLETFGGGEAQHCFSEVRFQAIEDRFAPAGGNSASDTFDDATDRVAVLPHLFDQLDHFRCGLWIGATDDVGLDLVERDCFGIDFGADIFDLSDEGEDFHGESFAEDFFCNGTRGDAANCLPRAAAAAALPITKAVFGLVGVIGVGRAEFDGHL